MLESGRKEVKKTGKRWLKISSHDTGIPTVSSCISLWQVHEKLMFARSH